MQDYDEDDFYADILKDDIIKLDESSISATPSNMLPVVANNSVAEQDYEAANNSVAEQNYKVPVQAIVSQPIPLQGTANRRIRLIKPDAIYTSKRGYFIDKIKCPSSPKRSISSARITVMSPLLFVIFVFMTLMVLLLALLGGLRHVKCIVCKSLCQGFSK